MSWYQQNEAGYQQDQKPSSTICNKLQSHKSSFQAWKCVSFGCSLLAIVLLFSKWYEVSTDLNLLLGINQLLAQHQTGQSNGSSLSWPPVPLDQLLPPINATGGVDSIADPFGMDSLENNGTMLMSHLHISLSREQNGNQLLRREVEAFIAEFRTAKSTLSLSSLLVVVYIVSWILMTLAINDARISNDISLRNILLLSVFGAIDIAASVGFVMVRLIMYSVKNNSFTADILGSAALRDAPVRLTADQLTAFTALRLIGMRSCSAYVDIYVSVVVASLNLLRLYAILRALTYYRRLRRLNDSRSHRRSLEHLLQSAPPNLKHGQQIWSTPSPLTFQAAGGQTISQHHSFSQPQHLFQAGQLQTHNQGVQYQGDQFSAARANQRVLSVGTLKPASANKRAQLVMVQKQSAQPRRTQPDRKHQPIPVIRPEGRVHQKVVQPQPSKHQSAKSTSGQLVLLNGCAHRLLMQQPTSAEETAPKSRKLTERRDLGANKRIELVEGNLLPEGVSFRQIESSSSEADSASQNETNLNDEDDDATLPIEPEQPVKPATRFRSSGQNLLNQQTTDGKRTTSTLSRAGAATGANQNTTCYTLLTAKQLDRLSRRLIADKSTSSGKYRLVSSTSAKYRPLAEERQPLGATLRHSGGSQALSASPEEEEAAASDSDGPLSGASSDAGQQRRGEEELLAGAHQKLFELSPNNQEEGVQRLSESQQLQMLGKYYYA